MHAVKKIVLHLLLSLLVGWFCWLHQYWVSCGCWENPRFKLWSTVIGYTICMRLLFGNASKSMRLRDKMAFLISIMTFNVYLLHYALPFRLIPRIGETPFILGSLIPIIASVVSLVFTTRILYAALRKPHATNDEGAQVYPDGKNGR